MDYVIGSVLTMVAFWVLSKLISKETAGTKIPVLDYSQSRKHDLTKWISYIEKDVLPPPLTTQATAHFDSIHKRVVLTEKKAYWIDNIGLVEAAIVDGQVVPETKKVVDTMALNPVELDELQIIVKALTEGKPDESSNSGDEELF